MNSRKVRRIKSSVEKVVESDFNEAPRFYLPEPIVVNAHELLDYARMLAEIANCVRDRVLTANAGLVGFPTGSIALALECSIALDIGPKVHFIRDLKHSPKGESKKDRERKLFNLLDDLHAAEVDEYLVLDEVVSGGSFAGTSNSIATWAARKDLKNLRVTLLGASELHTDECERILRKIARKRKNDLQFEIRVFRCNKLLALDKLGDITGGITKCADFTGYDWARTRSTLESGEPALYVRCPNEGPETSWCSRSDIASSFASIVVHILRPGTPEFVDSWPETILRDKACPRCVSLLEAARKASG